MRRFINTLLDIVFIIVVFDLMIAVTKWYRHLSPLKRKLYLRLFMAYLLLLALGSLLK